MSTSPAKRCNRASNPDNGAVLVTGPSCADPRIGEDANVVKVEHERCENVQTDPRSGNGIFQMISGILAPNTTAPEPVELQNLTGGESVDIRPKAHGTATSTKVVSDFDDCREYSYEGYTESAETQQPTVVPDDDHYHAKNQSAERAFILGRSYHPMIDYNIRRDDESSLFWFTYRSEFPEIVPYGITSDSGWGCMLRSAQMLLGQALRVHYKSRDWKPARLCNDRRKDPFIRSMLTWFADFPSTTQNFYSLHNMVAAGMKYDKLPGEWYGPQIAAHVLRDLVEMHERYQLAKIPQIIAQSSTVKRIFRVHVASSQGTVYRDEVRKLMTRESQARLDAEKEKKQQSNPQAHPLDFEWEEELVETVGNVEWDTSLLLLIPARLGLNSFNASYEESVAHTFSFPQSVGCLGGRVRGARWFYGAVSDGSKVFGLDPHTVQTAPRNRSARINGKIGTAVDLTDEYLRSCHTTYHEVLMLTKMDPSIALGFYCRNEQDLENLFSLVQRWNTEHPGQTPIFSVEDSSPDYASGMGGSSMMDAPFDESNGESDGEDDDFVML